MKQDESDLKMVEGSRRNDAKNTHAKHHDSGSNVFIYLACVQDILYSLDVQGNEPGKVYV